MRQTKRFKIVILAVYSVFAMLLSVPNLTFAMYSPLTAIGGKPIIVAHIVRLESGTVELALQVLASGKTIKAVRIDNLGGVSSLWRSDAEDESATPISVKQGGTSLSSGMESMAFAPGDEEILLSLTFKDNGSFSDKNTDFRVTLFFSDSDRAFCELSAKQIAQAYNVAPSSLDITPLTPQGSNSPILPTESAFKRWLGMGLLLYIAITAVFVAAVIFSKKRLLDKMLAGAACAQLSIFKGFLCKLKYEQKKPKSNSHVVEKPITASEQCEQENKLARENTNNISLTMQAIVSSRKEDLDKLHQQGLLDFRAKYFNFDGNETLMHIAARGGHLVAMKWLKKHDRELDVDVPSNNGDRPIHLATRAGHIDAVRWLLDNGKAGINVSGQGGQTPMHYAVNAGELDMMRYLEKWGADLSVKTNGGISLMTAAAIVGQVESIRCLNRNFKIGVNIPDSDGWTAIFHAASMGQAEAIKCLIELGAKADMPDKHGIRPTDVAKRYGHSEAVKYLQIDSGAKVVRLPKVERRTETTSYRRVDSTPKVLRGQIINLTQRENTRKIIKNDLCDQCRKIHFVANDGSLMYSLDEWLDSKGYNSPMGFVMGNHAALFQLQKNGGCSRCIALFQRAISG